MKPGEVLVLDANGGTVLGDSGFKLFGGGPFVAWNLEQLFGLARSGGFRQIWICQGAFGLLGLPDSGVYADGDHRFLHHGRYEVPKNQTVLSSWLQICWNSASTIEGGTSKSWASAN